MARKPADQSVSRKDIILAAADVLHRNGYEATTMKDIAAEVNLTAASLYHHFRNKDTLLLAVLEGGLDIVIEMLEPIVTDESRSYAEKLTEMMKVHVNMLTQNTAVGAAMIFEIRPLLNFSPLDRDGDAANTDFAARRDAFFERRDYFEQLYRRVLQRGVEAGEFRELDVKLFVKTMLGANNWVAVWYREDGPLDGETIASRMAEMFLHALKPTQA